MVSQGKVAPDFLLIGAQKSGTSWLWKMLGQHPEIDFPDKKEIHYFGGVEKYRQGREWYYSNFADLDTSKVIGEASTTYFYDYMPFWHNESSSIETDPDLPSIPELVASELPDVKIIVMLRDPVKRAISAYRHNLGKIKREKISEFLGLKEVAIKKPKMRILEYGFYARYLKLWNKFFPPEKMRILIFEEDVVKYPEKTVRGMYDFLGVDPEFQPADLRRRFNSTKSITRQVMGHTSGSFLRKWISRSPGEIFDKYDFLRSRFIGEEDLEFLRSVYLEEKAELEELTGRDLSCWKYGKS